MQFTNFHTHTDYSLLHSPMRIKELLSKAKEYNYKSIAITELGNMFSTIDFYKQAKEIKPIIGIDSYVDNHRLILIAKDEKGYQNLMYLTSISYLYNYDTGIPIIKYEELASHQDGITVIANYLESEIGFNLNIFNEENILKGAKGYQEAKNIATKFKNELNDFYLEIRRDGLKEEKFIENDILKLSKELEIPLLASSDIWYLNQEDYIYKDALECIADNKQFDDLHRGIKQAENHLKTNEEMIKLFKDLPEAIANTQKLDEKVTLKLDLGNPTPPKFKFTKEYSQKEGLEFDNDAEYFAYKCRQGLEARLKNISEESHKEYKDRLEYEIKIINQMKFPGYMLIVWDFVREAESRKPHIPVGPGRGCLTKEALIYTKNGLKNLNKVKKGDYVLTHKNRFKKVKNSFEYRVEEELLTIQTFYGDFINPITLTKEHKIYLNNQKWIKAENLTTKDYLTIPIPKREIKTVEKWDLTEFYEKDDYKIENNYLIYNFSQNKKNPFSIKELSQTLNKHRNTIKKYLNYLNKEKTTIQEKSIIEIETYLKQHFKNVEEWKNYIENLNRQKTARYLKNTKYFRKFLGRWIGDGHIRKDKSRAEVSIVFHKKDKKGIEETLNFIKENNYKHSILHTKNIIYIHIQDKFLHSFFMKLFNKYKFESNSKYIPEFVFELEKNEILDILDGYVSADGYTTDKRIKMTTVSKKLAQQLKTLLFYIGIPASLRKAKRRNTGFPLKKGNSEYIINIPANGSIYDIPKERKNIYKIEKDYIVLKIRKIESKIEKTKVYDIEVTDDNSYTTTNYIVHNSAAGSLVAYSLKITNIDPLKYGLIFERFLNPERVSMPDIDMDFCQEKRGDIIEYVRNKYGKENVAQVITFGSLLAKGVLRDVSRIFGIDYSIADNFVKLIPDELGIKLTDAKDKEPKIAELVENEAVYNRLYDFGLHLEGTKRNTGMHAAGVVISDNKLWEKTPLYKQDENYVSQYSLNYLEDVDLIKFDFLGLKTLTVIDNALNKIKENYDKVIDFTSMEMDDKKVYELISSGNTLGLFQIESDGMQDLNRRLKPDCFEDLVAVLALYRPGPMDAGMTDDFVERKNGKQEISYFFDDFKPLLEPILEPTYGVIVYQEQVMKIVQVIGGFTLGESDIIRRAMGKKNIDYMKQKADEFATGAEKKGLKKEDAIEFFGLIEKFAGYGFNKSHSAAYAMITYQTTYLKTYYPAEFMSSILSSEKDNTDKIVKYIDELKRINVKLLPPDVEISNDDFRAKDRNVVFGLGAIKGVGSKAIESIVENRPFKDLEDFILKVDTSKVNKRVLEALTKSGAMDKFKYSRKALLSQIEDILEYKKRVEDGNKKLQNSLFGVDDFIQEKLTLRNISEFELQELIDKEFEALGFYVSAHPLDPHKDKFEGIEYQLSSQIDELMGNEALFVGKITAVKKRMSKKGKEFGIISFMDFHGKFDFMVFSNMLEEIEELDLDEPIAVRLSLSQSGDFKRINCKKIIKLEDAKNEKTNIKKSMPPLIKEISINEENMEQELVKIYSRAMSFIGGQKLILKIKTPFGFSLEIDTKMGVNENF